MNKIRIKHKNAQRNEQKMISYRKYKNKQKIVKNKKGTVYPVEIKDES